MRQGAPNASPVVAGQERGAGKQAGEVAPGRPQALQSHVAADDREGQRSLVVDEDPRARREPGEPRAAPPGKEEGRQPEQPGEVVLVARHRERRHHRPEREGDERDAAEPGRNPLADPSHEEGAEEEGDPDREQAHPPEAKVGIARPGRG